MSSIYTLGKCGIWSTNYTVRQELTIYQVREVLRLHWWDHKMDSIIMLCRGICDLRQAVPINEQDQNNEVREELTAGHFRGAFLLKEILGQTGLQLKHRK